MVSILPPSRTASPSLERDSVNSQETSGLSSRSASPAPSSPSSSSLKGRVSSDFSSSTTKKVEKLSLFQRFMNWWNPPSCVEKRKVAKLARILDENAAACEEIAACSTLRQPHFQKSNQLIELVRKLASQEIIRAGSLKPIRALIIQIMKLSGYSRLAEGRPAIFQLLNTLREAVSTPAEKVEKLVVQSLVGTLSVSLNLATLGQPASIQEPFTFENQTRSIPRSLRTQEAADFVEQVNGIRTLLKQLKNEEFPEPRCVDRIRARISRAMESPFYRQFINEDIESINFLQLLSKALIDGDPGTLYDDFAKEEMGIDANPEAHYSWGDFGVHLDSYLTSSGANKRNTKLEEGRYFATHLDELWHSRKAKSDPLGYVSSEGNLSLRSPPLHRMGLGGRKTIGVCRTPGHTGDNILERGLLALCRKTGTFMVHITHQESNSKSERARIDAMEAVAERHPDVFRHIVIDANTHFKRAKKSYADVESFIGQYKAFAMDGIRELRERGKDNGYKIPADLLSDSQIESLFEQARWIFEQLGVNEMIAAGANKENIAKGMIYFIDLLFAAAIQYQLFNDPRVRTDAEREALEIAPSLSLPFITGACKENLDRRPKYKLAERLTDIMERGEAAPAGFSGKELQEWFAHLVAHAHASRDRDPQHKHLKPLILFAQIVGNNDALVAAGIKAYREKALPLRSFDDAYAAAIAGSIPVDLQGA